MTRPIEADLIVITRRPSERLGADHDYTWALREQGWGTLVATAAEWTSAIALTATLAGVFDLDATVDYYCQRIVKGSLPHADSACGNRYRFEYRGYE